MDSEKKIIIKFKTLDDNLAPYIDKAKECLAKTDIKKELIDDLEKAIRKKSLEDHNMFYQKFDFIKYKEIYMRNARHIIDNLKSTNSINNLYLIERVNNLTFSPDEILNLKPEEMHPKRWEFYIEKKTLEIEKTIKDPEATTELFRCNRCHRNKCVYFERQDRSADEPMTTHITCCYCGKRWRQ